VQLCSPPSFFLTRYESVPLNQVFFLDIVKKTQAQKNSKLKQNLEKTQTKSEKTQKPPTPVEFRWWIFLQTLKFSPFLPMWSIFETVNLKV